MAALTWPAHQPPRSARWVLLAGLVLFPVWMVGTARTAAADNCSPLDIGCHIASLPSDFIGVLAVAFVEAVGEVVKAVTTFWITVPTPQLATDASGTPSDPVAFLQSSLGFYTGVLATLSTAVGLARIAWASRSGALTREVSNLSRSLLTFLCVTSFGLAAVWGGVQAGDAFSAWILFRSTAGTDFAVNMTAVLGLTAATGIGAPLLAFIAFLDMIFGFLQLIAMIGRGGALVIVSGVWPTAASFRTIEAGEQWYRRVTGWLIGLILYKPACAIVYAAAFRMIGQHAFGTNGLTNIAVGMFMLLLAVFAAPLLAKFAVPLVAAAHFRGGGGGGAALLGAVATGAAIIGGYVQSHGGGGGGGPRGGPGGSGPPGPPSGGTGTPPPTGAPPAGAGSPNGGAPTRSGAPAGTAVTAGVQAAAGVALAVGNAATSSTSGGDQ